MRNLKVTLRWISDANHSTLTLRVLLLDTPAVSLRRIKTLGEETKAGMPTANTHEAPESSLRERQTFPNLKIPGIVYTLGNNKGGALNWGKQKQKRVMGHRGVER